MCMKGCIMSSNVALECKSVFKKVSKRVIIKDVSFSLYEGDILGFIGSNGEGKTTLIKLILGLQKMNRGSVKIFSYDIKKNFEKAISYVGAIVENPDLYMYLSGYENLKIVSRVYHVSSRRLEEVISLVGLQDRIHDKVCKYSLGMRQRLGIAQAILHHPRILILDEPMNGLDPNGMDDLKRLLIYLANKEKMAILISSHILSELESFCTRICILANGSIVMDDTIENIKKVTDKVCYILELSSVEVDSFLYQYEKIDEHHIMVCVSCEELSDILKLILFHHISIYEVKKQERSLEDIFLGVTKKSLC